MLSARFSYWRITPPTTVSAIGIPLASVRYPVKETLLIVTDTTE